MSAYDQPTAHDAHHLPPVPTEEPHFAPENSSSHDGSVRRGELQTLRRAAGPAQIARFILGTVLAVLLTATWLGSATAINDAGSPSDWSSDLDSASMINELNNEETEGAPQQAVVNGWYANDIAVVQAEQNTHLAATSARNGTLLFLIGLGIAGELIIRGAAGGRPARSEHKPVSRTEVTA